MSKLDSLRSQIKILENSCPNAVPMNAFNSIDPLRAVALRESAYGRITELAKTAYESCEKDRLVSAIILARALMETEAFFGYFLVKLEQAIGTGNLDGIRDFLTKALRGVHKSIAKDLNRPSSDRVTVYVNEMDQITPNYSKQYEFLCEFSHPNSAGLHRMYSKWDFDKREILFTDNRDVLSIDFVIDQLAISLDFFTYAYNRSADLLEAFVVLCEDSSKKDVCILRQAQDERTL